MNFEERILRFATRTPQIAEDAYIAPGAALIGDVTLGKQSSVWFQAAIRADLNCVRIGACSNIQDGAVIHVADAYSTEVGDWVTVGHGAVLHACSIGDEVLVGMNSVILDGARVGARSIVGANALVTGGTEIPQGSLVLGSPARVVRSLSDAEQAGIADWANRYILLANLYRRGEVQIVLPPLPHPPSV